MSSECEQIRSQLKDRLFALFSSMFDIFVVEFISESARNEIRVEFKGQLQDAVGSQSVGFEGLYVVREWFSSVFYYLIVGMDSCQFEYFVLQSTHCVLQIDRKIVLLIAHQYAYLTECCLKEDRL